jgi:hypothetical protein
MTEALPGTLPVQLLGSGLTYVPTPTGLLPAAAPTPVGPIPAALITQLDNPASLPGQAAAAEAIASIVDSVDPEWVITIWDYLWRPIGATGDDMIECSGTDPRNALPAATLKLQGNSTLIPALQNCRTTMVGVTVETEGLRFPFYVDTHDYEYTEKGEWTSTANLLGIWDILNYLQIWPD